MTRTAQGTAALKANLLETAVIASAVIVALTAAIVTARMVVDQGPLLQLVWTAAVTVSAYLATRGLLRLIVRDAQHRLHVAAGCVDCTQHG